MIKTRAETATERILSNLKNDLETGRKENPKINRALKKGKQLNINIEANHDDNDGFDLIFIRAV